MEYTLVMMLSGGFFGTGLRYPAFTECLDNQVAHPLALELVSLSFSKSIKNRQQN